MEIVKKDLATGITVYRPNFNNLSNTLEIIKKSMDGHTLLLNVDPEIGKEYPSFPDRWQPKPTTGNDSQIMTSVIKRNVDYLKNKGVTDYDEILLHDELENIYRACFKDYLKSNQYTKMQLPYVKHYDYVPDTEEWFDQDFSIHKHKAKSPSEHMGLWESEQKNEVAIRNDGFLLHWHFDEFKFKNERHYRHAVTGNIYLNDDYVSGRIMFVYGNNCDNFRSFDNLNVIAYKPMAGDLIFYPSFWPVAHSVTAPFNTDRFFVSKIFKYLYKQDDFNDEFMKYCEKIYNEVYQLGFFNIPQERMKVINGKELWSDL